MYHDVKCWSNSLQCGKSWWGCADDDGHNRRQARWQERNAITKPIHWTILYMEKNRKAPVTINEKKRRKANNVGNDVINKETYLKAGWLLYMFAKTACTKPLYHKIKVQTPISSEVHRWMEKELWRLPILPASKLKTVYRQLCGGWPQPRFFMTESYAGSCWPPIQLCWVNQWGMKIQIFSYWISVLL